MRGCTLFFRARKVVETRIRTTRQDFRAIGSGKTKRSKKLAHAAVSLISLMFVMGTFLPAIARASVLSAIIATFTGTIASAQNTPSAGSIQTVAALRPAMNLDPAPASGGGDITIIDNSALVPEEGPAGTMADIVKPKNATISTYVVREGDSLAGIAKLFNVSQNTIRWANDLSATTKLVVGQKLTILPITGVKYTVKRGDTLASIAKKYSADATEVGNANGIDDGTLAVGESILIPDGEIAAPAPKPKAKTVVKASVAVQAGPRGSAIQIGYYSAPLSSYTETQGVHGYNGVDLAAPVGTAIMASAAGDVIVAKAGGYNGGYGSYVVIQHDNGSQTLYAHMSKVSTYDGERVAQGAVIGYVGLTGKTTGAHVHFEIRNGIRNPF